MDKSNFIQYIENSLPNEKVADIIDALNLAESLMANIVRYSGDPFINHSINMASIAVSMIGLGRRSVIAILLHDPVRLGLISLDEVGLRYGLKVQEILTGLTKISNVDPKTSLFKENNFKELIVSYSSDPRIILIKIADRLEVMRSLDSFPKEKRIKKSWETIYVYAPIAHKLGLYTIKSELEDLSLKYLEPDSYNYIQQQLKESEEQRQEFIRRFSEPIINKLDSLGISYKLKSRTKSIYSIWRKMKKQDVDFNGVYDVFAIRIIVDCPRETEKVQCWTIFSIVTDFYTPNPDRMRDWISIPKSTGYESLHTTVVTKDGRWVEVQIRTTRMDDIAEHGIAAHWRYKGVSEGADSSAEWLNRVRDIVETSADGSNMVERLDFSSSFSEIFVFTPKGDLRKLPKDSSVLDFAFDIHTSIGKTCVGGKVNNKNVPIRHKLHSGDIVEILTSKNQSPKLGWLSFVKTAKARVNIQQILRQMEAEQAKLGREELERKIHNWKVTTINIDQLVSKLVKVLKLKTANELYEKISTGKISMSQIKSFIFQKEIDGQEQQKSKNKQTRLRSKSSDLIAFDKYANGMEYKLAKCCNPVFGDDIFGFVTINSGVTVHRKKCPNAVRLMDKYPYRILNAKWKKSDGAFLVVISVMADNRTGMASDITEMVSSEFKLDLRKIVFSSTSSSDAIGELCVEVSSTSQIDMLIANIKKIKGVRKVFRKL